MNPATLTLAQTRAALDANEISATELTEFYLARIARYDPKLNSFITVTSDLAREQAARADTGRTTGAAPGAMRGIPLALKDLYDLKGVRTTAGSKILKDNVATADATVTTRLKTEEAVILGKNNMHEFAFGVTNENVHYGNACNPWNVENITGGSSGGGAAAVAARLCLGALGSDTGGSIRIPASLCGISGLKPTYGRVSLRGVVPLSWSNDHAGPLAQTAEDCALILNAIAGYDAGDPACVNVPTQDYAAGLGDSLRGVRFAALRGYFEDEVDAEILSAVRDAEKVLEGMGAVCVEKELPHAAEMFDANRLTLRVEAAAYHREWLATRANEYGEDVLTRLSSFAQIRADEYALAMRKRVELRRVLDVFFDDIGFIVTPTTRVVAPRQGGDAVTMAQHLTAFTAPFDVTGVPAISIPCGFTRAGLPIGMQLVGRAWDEARVLQAAHQYQIETDWHARVPRMD